MKRPCTFSVDVVFQISRFDEVINHLFGIDPRFFALLFQFFALVCSACAGSGRSRRVRVACTRRRRWRRADRWCSSDANGIANYFRTFHRARIAESRTVARIPVPNDKNKLRISYFQTSSKRKKPKKNKQKTKNHFEISTRRVTS